MKIFQSSTLEIQNRQIISFEGSKKELDLLLNSGVTLAPSAKVKIIEED